MSQSDLVKHIKDTIVSRRTTTTKKPGLFDEFDEEELDEEDGEILSPSAQEETKNKIKDVLSEYTEYKNKYEKQKKAKEEKLLKILNGMSDDNSNSKNKKATDSENKKSPKKNNVKSKEDDEEDAELVEEEASEEEEVYANGETRLRKRLDLLYDVLEDILILIDSAETKLKRLTNRPVVDKDFPIVIISKSTIDQFTVKESKDYSQLIHPESNDTVIVPLILDDAEKKSEGGHSNVDVSSLFTNDYHLNDVLCSVVLSRFIEKKKNGDYNQFNKNFIDGLDATKLNMKRFNERVKIFVDLYGMVGKELMAMHEKNTNENLQGK